MADDPNRDIWPVREGSLCADTCRSSIDPRERHIVCKLDRYQLEDRYLRLLDEANDLKKLSNSQEDKIKRLATKLMRVSANPRSCPAVVDVYEDKSKIIALETENSKLKDKISVLRNQLLSHTIAGRSSSRSRHPQTRPSSGRITCRSENSRIKIIPSCHCIVQTASEDSNARNSIEKIQELEAQKEEMSDRISELEKELSSCSLINQKQKVAENVEYIKVWRQMKQLNDKLVATEAENESLNTQINDLKRMLEEKTKSNEEIMIELLEEKKRMSQIDEQMLIAKESELSLREKDEQIKDLVNEMKILQQHNNELIDLSSKYGEVELENKELKKQVSQQFQDQECLKTAFSNEQTNIVTLQTSNEQLLGKLEELQKNIDNLTVQLTSFQTQTERQGTSAATQVTTKMANINIPLTTGKPKLYGEIATQVEKCSKCCKTFQNTLQVDIGDKLENYKVCTDNVMHTTKRSPQLTEKSIQTDSLVKTVSNDVKDQGTSIMTPVKEKPKKEESPAITQRPEPTSAQQTPLTPEKMLKLLDQAQISPTTRLTQKNMDCSNILDQNQRHSGTETILQVAQENAAFQSISNPYQQQQTNKDSNASEHLDNQLMDRNQILTALFNMLQEQPPMNTIPIEGSTLYRPIPPIKSQFVKDLNNNIDTTTGVFRTGCSTKKSCSTPHAGQHQEKCRKRLFTGIKKYSRTSKFSESNDCTCNSFAKWNQDADCEGRCYASPRTSKRYSSSNIDMHSTARPTVNKNDPAKDSKITVQNVQSKVMSGKILTRNLGSTYISRQLQDDAKPFNSWERSQCLQKGCNNDESLDEYMKHLDKCRELVNGASGIPVKEIVEHAKFTDPLLCRNAHKPYNTETQRMESYCSIDCPNDCIEITSSPSGSFPLVIGDGQGLLELHIVSLQLSTSAKQILFREKDIGNISLFVSWDMWNQETAYTPTLKCPKLNFNSSFVYRIPDLFSFFNFVLLEFVIFQVNVFHEDNGSYAVAKGKLCIKDILDYPQNKLYYIAPVNSVIPCSVGANFGQLSLWVRLSCDVEKVEAFTKKRRSQWEMAPGKSISELDHSEEIATASKDELLILKEGTAEQLDYDTSKDTLFKESESKPRFTDKSSDTKEMKALDAQIVPNKNVLAVVTESEEDSAQIGPETKLMTDHHKSFYADNVKWKESSSDATSNNIPSSSKVKEAAKSTMKPEQSTQSASVVEFNATMTNGQTDDHVKSTSNESIHEVNNIILEKNWEKYKHRSLIAFNASGIESEAASEIEALAEAPLDKDTILIEIVNMILLPKSSVMQNDEYQLLYIEYSFLGYCGVDMETKSVQKPQPPSQKLTYNFKRKFRVDEEKHALQNNILRAMLDDTTNPNIKFIIVCEPVPEETDIKECVEIGFANINIREYALGDSEKIVSLPIFSPDENEQIGLLKICVLGRDTIRQYLGKRESIL